MKCYAATYLQGLREQSEKILSILYQIALSGGAGCSAKVPSSKTVYSCFLGHASVGERLGSEQTGITVNNRRADRKSALPRLQARGSLWSVLSTTVSLDDR